MRRVVIIEDETAAAVNLQAILRECCPEAEVEAVLEGVEESVEWLEHHTAPDLIFADIHLSDGNSFRIFERTQITSPVIFTTAYDQYAIEAFHVNSIDYLLKPINPADLTRALEKLRRLTQAERDSVQRRIRSLDTRAEHAPSTPQEIFLIQQRDRIIPLQRREIAFFHTADEHVSAYDMAGRSYPVGMTLDMLSTRLPEGDFFRANRQFIISREAIRDISVWFGGRLTLHLKIDAPERIVISKARVREFKAWLTAVSTDL